MIPSPLVSPEYLTVLSSSTKVSTILGTTLGFTSVNAEPFLPLPLLVPVPPPPDSLLGVVLTGLSDPEESVLVGAGGGVDRFCSFEGFLESNPEIEAEMLSAVTLGFLSMLPDANDSGEAPAGGEEEEEEDESRDEELPPLKVSRKFCLKDIREY